MERYLKEEPKFGSHRKLAGDEIDTSWDMFAPPESPPVVNGAWKMEVNLNKLNLDQHMDALSTMSSSSSCSSRLSWDASLSYAVLAAVKKEPIDTDYEDNSDSYEEVYSSSSSDMPMALSPMAVNGIKKERRSSAESQNAIKFTIVARSQLTPPSSPEPNASMMKKMAEGTDCSNNNNSISINNKNNNRKSLVRMNPLDSTQISRNTIVKLTTAKNSSIGVARLIHVAHPKLQATQISDSKAVSIVNPPCKFHLNNFYSKNVTKIPDNCSFKYKTFIIIIISNIKTEQ